MPGVFDKAQYCAGYKLYKSLLSLDSVTDVCYNKQDPGRAFCHAGSQIVNGKGRYDTLNLSIMPLEKEHMAEYNRRAGTNMTREELYAHTQGSSEEDKRYTQIYVDVQRDGIVSAVKAMREGLDEVDPSIQGIVSGIYVTTFCEFSGDTGVFLRGKAIRRL